MSAEDSKKIMAKNLQHYMDINGKTRKDICAALGIKYTTLTEWCKGTSYPRIDKVEMLANYFGVNKADLVEPHDGDWKPLPSAEPSTREDCIEWIKNDATMDDLSLIFSIISDRFKQK